MTRTIAVGLYKICNDLRLMSSGPRTGLAEITVPDLQPGSSIMPGKVNPVICEAVSQVCAQVIGNDAAVAFGGAAGNFELNVMLPVIGRNLLGSLTLLSAAARLLADKCVAGITAHAERLRHNAESSPSIVTALNPYIGYEAAAADRARGAGDRRDHPGRDRRAAATWPAARSPRSSWTRRSTCWPWPGRTVTRRPVSRRMARPLTASRQPAGR